MKKNDFSILSALFIVAVLCLMYFTLMPRWNVDSEGPLSEFSYKRTMTQIKEISKAPHFVGSQNHQAVAAYLEKELQELGLETTTQQGSTLSDWGNLVYSKNIMARIKGSDNSKALLLLSHYDSAPHSSSRGASDDGSGVATILEGLRAFLHNKTPHKNDIIIVFTDAEELGLNGAVLFVTKHQWAKDISVALNFEARGTSGPGYMLMEVNNGNSQMVDAFAEANTSYPASNSLMYSIYKMLPNDTDLTVFREQGKIQGYNFAFIDDHFNYHTAQDDYAHLDPETIAHQGTYLMPLLRHFSNSDLTQLQSNDDQVYFNAPFVFVHYPFGWNIPLLIAALVLFIFLAFVGARQTHPAHARDRKRVFAAFGRDAFGRCGYFLRVEIAAVDLSAICRHPTRIYLQRPCLYCRVCLFKPRGLFRLLYKTETRDTNFESIDCTFTVVDRD
jgi:hypothetical protein